MADAQNIALNQRLEESLSGGGQGYAGAAPAV